MSISSRIFIFPAFLVASICFWLLMPASVSACVTPLIPNDIQPVPTAPIANNSVKLYASINPNCDQDVEGTVTFSIDGIELGTSPFSYKALGRTEEVWIAWTPEAPGVYMATVNIISDTLEGGSLSKEILVVDDNDGDGIADSLDPDDDNDGVSDYEEGNQLTDPNNPDTDGDTVNDLEDAFPLDPEKTEEEPVIPPPQPSHPPEPAPEPQISPEPPSEPEPETPDLGPQTSDETETPTSTAATITEYQVVSTAPGSFVSNEAKNKDNGENNKQGKGGAKTMWGVAILFAALAGAFELKHNKKKKK